MRPVPRHAPLATAIASSLVVVAAIGAVGLRTDFDSQAYLATAQQLLDGRGLRSSGGGADGVHYPPGLAVVLAVLHQLGLSWLTSGIVINAASWIAAIVASDRLYVQFRGRSGFWRAAVVLWVGASGAMALTANRLMTEPLYLALSLWFLVIAERWVRGPTVGLTILTWALGAAALSVRYVGICLIGGLILRALAEPVEVRRRAQLVLVPMLSVVPLAAWYAANVSGVRSDGPAVSGTAVGFDRVLHSIGALGALPIGLPYNNDDTIVLRAIDPLVRAACVAVGLALCALAIGCGVRRLREVHRAGRPVRPALRSSGALLTLAYVGLYLPLMVVWRIPAGYSILGRYWLPIIVPLVLLAAAQASRRRVAIGAPAMAATGAFLLLNLAVGLVWVVH